MHNIITIHKPEVIPSVNCIAIISNDMNVAAIPPINNGRRPHLSIFHKAIRVKIRLIIPIATESLSDEVTNSPIVSEDYVVKGFAAINYVF